MGGLVVLEDFLGGRDTTDVTNEDVDSNTRGGIDEDADSDTSDGIEVLTEARINDDVDSKLLSTTEGITKNLELGK